MQWIGPAIYASISLPDLQMMKELISLRADPHAPSSNNANLVWQCSYFGKLDALKYLLSLGVAHSDAGKSQDVQGLSHTPLHIAARVGNESCMKELVVSKAGVNIVNESNVSPLEDIYDLRCSSCSVLLFLGSV